jgi:hypothetical protein
MDLRTGIREARFMTSKRLWLSVLSTWLLCNSFSFAAGFARSRNFEVTAPNEEMAREFAKLAEKFRKEKALEWIGEEMPPWPRPCPLVVRVTGEGASGATTFHFNEVIHQEMEIQGDYAKLKDSVLPHEVTHTVFAFYFKQPVPRWADEGGSVYSENEQERRRHDDMCRRMLNAGRGIPLRRLFEMTQYPSDVMVLYAQGYSISRFLTETTDRKTFLSFVGHGMNRGWDDAVRTFYPTYRSVNELEAGWLAHLKRTGGRAAVDKNLIAAGNESSGTLVTRQNANPNRPELDPAPTTRGFAPQSDERPVTFSDRNVRGWNTSTISLGSPRSIEGRDVAIEAKVKPTSATPMQHRPPPPPVVLFPPEPIN